MIETLASHLDLLITLVAVGAVGGFLSGLLGVGGGMIFVPALYFTMKTYNVAPEVIMHMAVATSLALVLVTGATSAFWHNKKGAVDFTILRNWAPGVFVGVAAGTYFASLINGPALKQVFACFALLIAVYMAFAKEQKEGAPHRVSVLGQRCVAALIGGISSLIGIGGAMLTVPFMVYVGVPMRKCVGTGSALAFVIAFPGIFGYIFAGLSEAHSLPAYSLGYINLLALIAIVPVSMAFAPVGVNVSHKVSRTTLRRIFTGVLFLVSLRMLTI